MRVQGNEYGHSSIHVKDVPKTDQNDDDEVAQFTKKT